MANYRKVVNPIVSKSTTNPTLTGSLLSKVDRDIERRIKGYKEEVVTAFERIPSYSANASVDEIEKYVYGLTADQLLLLQTTLDAIAEKWLVSGVPNGGFWFQTYVEEASNLGTAQSSANLTQLSEVYAASRPIEAVLYSAPYIQRVAVVVAEDYSHWTGLASESKAKLSSIIAQGVADGVNPRSVVTQIKESLDVTRSKARSIAQTDIVGALRQARWAEADATEKEFGFKVMFLWSSALKPTTRPNHASRHGKVYSTKEVRAFYSVKGNKYNCLHPDTVVSGRFMAGLKSFYDGEMLKIVTASGKTLRVTPNHPLLTDIGLVGAGSLRKGDNLIAYSGVIDNSPLGVDALDCQLTKSTAQDVFGSLSDFGKSCLVGVGAVDFNGDEKFIQEDIHAVTSDSVLTFGGEPSCFEFLDNFSFVKSDPAFVGFGAVDALSFIGLPSSDCIMGVNSSGRLNISGLAFGAGGLSFGHVVDIDAVSDKASSQCAPVYLQSVCDAKYGFPVSMSRCQLSEVETLANPIPFVARESCLFKPLENSSIACADAISDLLISLSRFVSADEIVYIEIFHYNGHVYDLQEESGLMIADGIITSNCFCAQTEALVDDDGKLIASDTLKDGMKRQRDTWQKENE